jgi:hypothetical protein
MFENGQNVSAMEILKLGKCLVPLGAFVKVVVDIYEEFIDFGQQHSTGFTSSKVNKMASTSIDED